MYRVLSYINNYSKYTHINTIIVFTIINTTCIATSSIMTWSLILELINSFGTVCSNITTILIATSNKIINIHI